MAEEIVEEKEGKQTPSNEPNVLIAVLTYFIFFLPWLTGDIKDPFVKFHTKQSIVLVIASLLVWILGAVIPVIGWFIIGPVGGLIVFILWLIGVLNAIQKKEKHIPWIGQFGDKLDF